MTVRTFSLALAFAAACAGPVLAADGMARLASVRGDVRLATGKGLSAAGAGAALKAGDRIVARSGSAQVRYADGCVITAPSGSMITVGAASPCAGGAGLVSPGSAAALSMPDFTKMEVGAYVASAGVLLLAASMIAGFTYKDDPESP